MPAPLTVSSGGPLLYLIAFWLIAVDHFCDLGAEVVDCFGLTYAGRASPDILQHVWPARGERVAQILVSPLAFGTIYL